MAFDPRYQRQVQLLVRTLSVVAQEPLFALKGGTAINLFVCDTPRLSVDIDLACLSSAPREQALADCRQALARIADGVERQFPNTRAVHQHNRADELRVLVHDAASQIKIEVSPVLRGTVFAPEQRDVTARVEDLFGFVSVPVVSLPDLYGGKICAALDRQHPRDLFDVKQLLDSGDFDRSIFNGFLVYLLSHPPADERGAQAALQGIGGDIRA